jgi:lysophospholipase L1-like esterase
MLGVERLGGTIAERSVGAAGLTALDGSTDTVVLLSGGPYRIDQFKGYRVAVDTAGEGFVVSSNENSVTLRGPMAASAAAADAVTITVPTNDFGGTSAPKIRTHPGAQPGENAVLADLINQLQVLVVAFSVAT